MLKKDWQDYCFIYPAQSTFMREALIRKASSKLVALVSLIFLLIFIAAMKNPEIINHNKDRKSYTYLALGDSYTIGESLDPKENFPNQAVQMLRKQGLEFDSPVIIARTGWTTDELHAAIEKANLKKKYDFVTLLIGVNNQYRGRDVVDYIPQFETLLKKAINFTGNDTSNVIVISIPDWGVTPYADGRDKEQITREIDLYNAANRQLSSRYNVHYIDITPGSRLASQDTSLLADDKLHPSGKEYAIWAEQVAQLIKKRL